MSCRPHCSAASRSYHRTAAVLCLLHSVQLSLYVSFSWVVVFSPIRTPGLSSFLTFPVRYCIAREQFFCSPPSLTRKQYPLCCVAACLGCISVSAVPPAVCQFLQHAGCCLVSPGAHGAAAVTARAQARSTRAACRQQAQLIAGAESRAEKGAGGLIHTDSPQTTPLVAEQLGHPCWAP